MPKKTPNARGGKAAKRSRKSALASLMPARGSTAKAAKAELRALLVLDGLLGDARDRPIRLHSSIPELAGLGFTQPERDCFMAILHAEKHNFPPGGAALRFRIELAAAFLSTLISHAYEAAEGAGISDPENFAEVALDLAVERGREVWAQGSG